MGPPGPTGLTSRPAGGWPGAGEWPGFICPPCRVRLSDRPGADGLVCPACRRPVPRRGGVLRFVDDPAGGDAFGFQWNRFRTTQLDSRTGRPISRDRLFEVTGWPRDLRGQVVLEAGSGAGRFTEILLTTGATVFSFDASSAVDANRANNGPAPGLVLFQADIFDLPVPEAAFDKVLCLGVLQHTPDPARAFASLARRVRPGGQLVVDVYARRPRSLLSWKYLLRPLTTRLATGRLYRLIETVVPRLLPLAGLLRRRAGRAGARLLPIADYSHLDLPGDLNREWAILDTFDMYAPVHDRPQSIRTVRRWFAAAGFVDVAVHYGPNGVVGRGTRPGAPGRER